MTVRSRFHSALALGCRPMFDYKGDYNTLRDISPNKKTDREPSSACSGHEREKTAESTPTPP